MTIAAFLISCLLLFLTFAFFDTINMIKKFEGKGFLACCKFVFYGIDVDKEQEQDTPTTTADM